MCSVFAASESISSHPMNLHTRCHSKTMVIRQKTRAYAQRLSDEALGTREQEQEEDKVKKEPLVSLRDIHTLHFRDFHFFSTTY